MKNNKEKLLYKTLKMAVLTVTLFGSTQIFAEFQLSPKEAKAYNYYKGIVNTTVYAPNTTQFKSDLSSFLSSFYQSKHLEVKTNKEGIKYLEDTVTGIDSLTLDKMVKRSNNPSIVVNEINLPGTFSLPTANELDQFATLNNQAINGKITLKDPSIIKKFLIYFYVTNKKSFMTSDGKFHNVALKDLQKIREAFKSNYPNDYATLFNDNVFVKFEGENDILYTDVSNSQVANQTQGEARGTGSGTSGPSGVNNAGGALGTQVMGAIGGGAIAGTTTPTAVIEFVCP